MAKSLDLKVTLSAVNKATGPLKKIRDRALGTGTAMQETRERLRDLNEQQKRLSGFRDLSRQSLETRDALRQKREELKRVSDKLATTEGPTRRLEQQQANAKEAVRKLNDKYRTQRERVGELARKLPPATDGVRGMTEQQDALQRQIRDANDRLDAQREIMGRLSRADVGGKFRNMTTEVGRLGRRAAMLGGAAAGGIFALANSTATLGDDVAKTAAKIGVDMQALQELRYGAERSGLSTEKLDSSLERFVKRLGEAKEGGGAAAKAYEQLGLNADQLAKLSPDKALGVVADSLANVEGHADRVALMAALVGREGVAMINMLKDGSGGLDQFARDARAVGYALSDEAGRDAEEFKDALLDAQSGLKGMKNTIGAELMPAVTGLMRELSGWMRENRDQVKAFAREFGDRLKDAVPAIIEVAKGAATFAKTLGGMVNTAARLVGGFDNLAMVAGAIFAGKAIASVLSFAGALGTAGGAVYDLAMLNPKLAGAMTKVGTAMAALPIGWIVVGIAAVAAGALYLWKNWDWIGPKFAALWDDLRAMPGRAWAGIKAAFEEGIGGVARLLANWSPLGILWRGISAALGTLGIELPTTLTGLGGAIIDGLIGGLDAKWQALREKISSMADGVVGWFKEKLGINSPSRVFADFGANLLDGLINGIDEKWQLLKDKIGATAGAVTNWFKEKLGINSPSKVFAEFGVNTMQGYQAGIERSEDRPLREMTSFTRRLQQAGVAFGAAAMAAGAAANPTPIGMASFDSRPPLTAPASSSGGISFGDIHVHAAPGMDEKALARYVAAEVQRALAAAERDAAARRRSAFHDID
ncbi:hypothetical protein [Halomonas sp.]|uniref:hypothetical protein n=1 Tax=Halomonas sp. TaxID=1486246 RepID=UPI003D102CAC